MAIGDIPVIEERVIEKQDENGNTFFQIEYFEVRKINLMAALKALWIIGKHAAVQAFSQMVEIRNTEYLQKQLAEAVKRVEMTTARRN